MNEEQKKAVERLRRALNGCAKVGLSGGVFDSAFCVWPSGVDPEAYRNNNPEHNFFSAVDYLGERIFCDMHLDGGAGN